MTDFRVQQSCRFLAIALTIALLLTGLPALCAMQPNCNCCEDNSTEQHRSSPANLTIEFMFGF
jgi:hypothetical protein